MTEKDINIEGEETLEEAPIEATDKETAEETADQQEKKTENGIEAMDAKSEYDGDGDTSDRSDTIF